ncbi:hypothetical protein [Nocardioides sp. 1609]|uniref:hypothetical protein n=1 Tax=Nocardioides sp. 1609 TaxID=2508327 RepID=UPI00106F54BE|nr:hypothetical protein [Nocardioides sp. 1609]
MFDDLVAGLAAVFQGIGGGPVRAKADFSLSVTHPLGHPESRWVLAYTRRGHARAVQLRWLDPPEGYQPERRLGDLDRHDRRRLDRVGTDAVLPRLEARVTWRDEHGLERSSVVTTRQFP